MKLVVGDDDKCVFLAAGARGAAAIYTEHLTLVHIIRKVLLRVASYLDYIIIKHSISLGIDGMARWPLVTCLSARRRLQSVALLSRPAWWR